MTVPLIETHPVSRIVAILDGPPVANPSGIHPTEFCVLFLPDPVEEKTAGGIILTDEFKDREGFRTVNGRLVAVSPLAFSYETWPEGARIPRAGDRCIVSRHAGLMVKGKDGVDYRLLKDKEVLALLDGE